MPQPRQIDDLPQSLIDKFAAAEACWFSSVRPDDRAHLAPIWHVWYEASVYVVTPSGSVKARNIRRNPRVSLALPDPMNALIIEGVAAVAQDQRDALRPLFQTKYQWDIAHDRTYDTVIEVKPTKVIAWGEHGEGRWVASHD